MIEVNSTEFFVMALCVAMAVLALMFGQHSHTPAVTLISSLGLNPCVTSDDGLIVLQALDDGDVLLLRNGIPINDGDTVNLIVTIIDDKLKIVEKKGVISPTKTEVKVDGTATLSGVPIDRFHVRYESELTGQWALFTFTNRPGKTASSHLVY